MWRPRNSVLLLALALLATVRPASAEDAPALYQEHCASCHGVSRLGAIGPALIPQNLKRLRKKRALGVISKGRPATQMPGFAEKLTPDEITALADYVFTPLAEMPVWTAAEIEASRDVLLHPADLASRPIHKADPLNLFVVVESGDHHVTILDGDTFEPITRFKSRFALHGGPKFTPDGRFVYFGSRDGWVSKYDLWGLQLVAEARAGINTRNIAISHDGKVLAVANYLPHTLTLLSADDLSVLKVIPVLDEWKKESSRVSAVYQAAPRKSFIVALKDLPELWEISYEEDPPPVYSGMVHTYEKGMVEAVAQKGRFPIRRTPLKEPLDDFFFDQRYKRLMGSSRDGKRGVVVHLDVRRKIAELPLPGLPHLGSGITWTSQGRRVMATPHLKEAAVSIVDTESWTLVKRLETLGPGFFMRSHEESRYAWTDVFFGPNRDAVHIIDKESLEIVKTIRPAPGKVAAHVEFTRDGRYALLSIWDMEGAVIVYDAKTLEEVKRIPFVKPAGKYNVFNKITRSEGTSH